MRRSSQWTCCVKKWAFHDLEKSMYFGFRLIYFHRRTFFEPYSRLFVVIFFSFTSMLHVRLKSFYVVHKNEPAFGRIIPEKLKDSSENKKSAFFWSLISSSFQSPQIWNWLRRNDMLLYDESISFVDLFEAWLILRQRRLNMAKNRKSTLAIHTCASLLGHSQLNSISLVETIVCPNQKPCNQIVIKSFVRGGGL